MDAGFEGLGVKFVPSGDQYDIGIAYSGQGGDLFGDIAAAGSCPLREEGRIGELGPVVYDSDIKTNEVGLKRKCLTDMPSTCDQARPGLP